MRPLRAALLVGAAAAALGGTGCARRSTLYDWGAYDEGLYQHYKRPQDHEAWVATLKTAVLKAEEEGRKVPPGLYAEYGYALFEEGVFPQAIAYFQKERDLWPESRFFMEKMIRNAQVMAGRPSPPAPSPAATQGPAGALEKTP